MTINTMGAGRKAPAIPEISNEDILLSLADENKRVLPISKNNVDFMPLEQGDGYMAKTRGITMQQLQELNAQLLASPKYPFYNAEYYKVLPYIVELRSRGADKAENEIETCFNSLYGVMMLRLQQKEVTPNTSNAVKEISTFIGMLNDYYLKDKQEPLEF